MTEDLAGTDPASMRKTHVLTAPKPEHRTWALMLAGFGIVVSLTRRRAVTTRS
ncbi:MAG: hypothetical protein ABI671_16135 [Burkholderiales bacterium]